MTSIQTTTEFDRDVKKLTKKYESLESDLSVFYKALSVIRITLPNGTVRISNLGKKYEHHPIFKVRSFHCKSLKGSGSKSGIRVIYYDDVENDTITLLQIYHKSNTENQDNDRIFRFLDSIIE